MRMRADNQSLPKPMMPIGSRPVLWHVMRYYAHFGHTEFILCLGYGGQAVKDYFLSYRETASNDFVITKGGSVGLADGVKPGHIIAFFCAFVWSGYSVVSRRFGQVPTDVVAGYCLITAAVAFVLHLALETTVWPQGALQWGAILVLGAIPLGLGFYAWDFGVKHGDIMVLGALSYAAPLFSTIVLLAAGFAAFHWSVALACILITAGAVIAAKDMLFKPRASSKATEELATARSSS